MTSESTLWRAPLYLNTELERCETLSPWLKKQLGSQNTARLPSADSEQNLFDHYWDLCSYVLNLYGAMTLEFVYVPFFFFLIFIENFVEPRAAV